MPDRLQTVLVAIYLTYTTGQGRPEAETDLCSESIRLGRMLRLLMPDEPEVAGLLALMLLTESRRGTRTDEFGALVLLRDQNRAGWNRALIGEGHNGAWPMTEVIDETTDFREQHDNAEDKESGQRGVTRRNVLRAGAVGIAAVGLGAGKVLMQPSLQARGFLNPNGVFGAAAQAVADSLYIEVFPVSPLILNPFNDRELADPAGQPADLRGAARLGRW